jgi:RNA polymerase sigma-70 factor (ECF subfamily)
VLGDDAVFRIVDEPYSDPPAPGRLADEGLETEEALHLLRRSIGALPEPYRTAILLRDVEGMSLVEISEVAQDSVAALKSRIHRGRLRRREAMHRVYGERGDEPHKKD